MIRKSKFDLLVTALLALAAITSTTCAQAQQTTASADTINGGVINKVYNLASCSTVSPTPQWCSGSDIGEWTNAAITSMYACNGGPCQIVLPAGSWTQTTTIQVTNPNISIAGSGMTSTKLTYTGSGDAIVIQPSPFTTSPAGEFRDFQIVATSSATSGIHIISTQNAKLRNVEVSEATGTNAAAFWLDDQGISGSYPQWTERTTFWDDYSSNNTKGWRFTCESTDCTTNSSASFARTDLHSCHVDLNGSQIGLSLESGDWYHSVIELNGNMDAGGATLFSVAAGATASDNAYSIHVENSSGASSTFIYLGAEAVLEGHAFISGEPSSSLTNNLVSNSHFYIQGGRDPLQGDNSPLPTNGLGIWLNPPSSTDNYLMCAGFNARWDNTYWQSESDGGNNGGAAICDSYAPGDIRFYTIPVSNGASNQETSPSAFAGGIKAVIDPNGVGFGTATPSTSDDVYIDMTGDIKAAGNITAGGGGQTVYRCTATGTILPIGTLTVNTNAYGSAVDTGLRTK